MPAVGEADPQKLESEPRVHLSGLDISLETSLESAVGTNHHVLWKSLLRMSYCFSFGDLVREDTI